MKYEKLFKKIEKYFTINELDEERRLEKKDKLIKSLNKKLESMKEKIKFMENIDKKSTKKRELEVLQKLKSKLEQEVDLELSKS